MKRYIAGSGGKVPVIVAAAIALTRFTALVSGRLGEFLGFGLQQLVEGLLHAAADQLFNLALDYFLVELYNGVGHGLSSPFRMCVATSFYQRPASRVYFFAFYNLRNLLYLIKALLTTMIDGWEGYCLFH